MALEIGVNFKIFDESLFDLVFEMMPFQSDVFRLHFGAFTIGQHNIFKNLIGRQGISLVVFYCALSGICTRPC